jgi:hypothetical protein
MITERHLFLALETHRLTEDETLSDIATQDILSYAAHYLAENNLPLDDESIIEHCKKLTVDHMLNHMIQNGLLNEDYEGHLTLTEKGEELADTEDK